MLGSPTLATLYSCSFHLAFAKNSSVAMDEQYFLSWPDKRAMPGNGSSIREIWYKSGVTTDYFGYNNLGS